MKKDLALLLQAYSGAKVPKKQKSKNRSSPTQESIDSILSGNGQFNVPWNSSFPKAVTGFPDRLTVSLKYSDIKTFSGITPSAQVWYLNSAYDPDGTGAGHQPSYFDRYAAVYGKYLVEEFAIQAIINNDGAVANVATLGYSDVNDSGDSVNQLKEARYTKWVVIGTTTGIDTRTIKLPSMKQTQLQGQLNIEADNSMYSVVTSNPSDLCYGVFKTQCLDGTTSSNVRVEFTIVQRVTFKDLLPQDSS
jgi:hypothetical protein